jgi:hypothetical protein
MSEQNDLTLEELFFSEATEAFQFLEHQYGYQRQEGQIKSPDDIRDTAALLSYVGTRVGVQISWYFADAFIGVAFVELQQPGVFPQNYSFYPVKQENLMKAIDLYTLSEIYGVQQNQDFLLQDTDNPRKYKKHAKLIQTNRKGIIAGLARATQIYAAAILQGDTFLFPDVMHYYIAKHKQLHPDAYIPGDPDSVQDQDNLLS